MMFQVIFNDVPMPKPHVHAEQIYMPKSVGFEAINHKEFYDQLENYIISTNIKFSSYEVDLL